MTPYSSAFFTVALLCVAIVVSVLTDANGWPILLIVAGSAIWAAADSAAIGFGKYKNSVAYGPVGVGIFVLLLWVVAFPWYLTTRSDIKSGRLQPNSTQMGNSILWELFRVVQLCGGVGITAAIFSLFLDIEDSGEGKAFGKFEWHTLAAFAISVPVFLIGKIGCQLSGKWKSDSSGD